MVQSPTSFQLTRQTFSKGLRALSQQDAGLANILAQYGHPPFWSREPGYPTLVQIILEQQVSLSSAHAAFARLSAALDPLTPENFLQLDDPSLKAIGFSRQKISYVRGLSASIIAGKLNLKLLRSLDDQTARSELIKIKGIGRWTADIYLLLALRRADIWPVGDLALAKAVQNLHNFPALPDSAILEQTAGKWKPWRAVAARILWHYYLSMKER